MVGVCYGWSVDGVATKEKQSEKVQLKEDWPALSLAPVEDVSEPGKISACHFLAISDFCRASSVRYLEHSSEIQGRLFPQMPLECSHDLFSLDEILYP